MTARFIKTPNPYEEAAALLVRESGVTIRKYRKAMTGIAYVNDEDWGIEAPEPRGPVSFAVFAHEVGHQLLHRTRNRPRWQEEIEAWEYAIHQFDRLGLDGRGLAFSRAALGVRWAIVKALKRSPRRDALAADIIRQHPQWEFCVTYAEHLLTIRAEFSTA